MHLGAHVARIHHQDAEVGAFDRQHPARMLERRLRRAVATPPEVGLDRGIGGDVHDGGALVEELAEVVHQRDRCHDVHVEDAQQRLGGDGVELGERARAQGARVVDEQADGAQRGGGAGQFGAVRRVGDVAGDADDAGAGREAGDRGVEPIGSPGVDDEGPAPVGERVGERETETLGGAGDDRHRTPDGADGLGGLGGVAEAGGVGRVGRCGHGSSSGST